MFLALTVAHLSGGDSLDPSRYVGTLLELTMAAAWFSGSVGFVRIGRQRVASMPMWSAVSMGLLGLGCLSRAASIVDMTEWLVAGSTLTLLAGVAVLVSATQDLVDAYSREGRRFLAVNGELSDAQQVLDREAAHRAETTHDARGVIAALRAATTTLQRHDSVLDER